MIWAPNFSLREWKRNETQVAREYCWVINKTAGRSFYHRLGSDVLQFGLQRESLLCIYIIDHMHAQFRLTQIRLAPSQLLVFPRDVHLRGENLKMIDSKSFGNVAHRTWEWHYIQNYIHEEIRSSTDSRTACYHSGLIPLPCCLLSKNKEFKIHRNKMLSVSCRCEKWSVTLTEEHRLRASSTTEY